MAASKGRLQAVPMQEKPTQLLTASHVKDGRILSRIITISPTWEITTSVGILKGLLLPRFGSTPRIMKFCFNMSVPFYLPPSEKLLICCWTMIGKENRASYDNLKTETYLSLDEINMLWLSLVLYTNTDQQQTTRLGENWEGTTSVNVKREVN